MPASWTWLDYAFVVIIVFSTVFALTKGIARELISLVALVGGFIFAAYYYHTVARVFADYTRTETVANLLGFLVIFLSIILVGAIAAYIANRFVKMASLEWFDRVLGGVFGFLRGWAVTSIIVLALIAFPVRDNLVAQSQLAPYLLAGARAAVLVVPQELKDRFHEEYRKVLEAWNRNRSMI
jgi:membrane protein required for colicin V production